MTSARIALRVRRIAKHVSALPRHDTPLTIKARLESPISRYRGFARFASKIRIVRAIRLDFDGSDRKSLRRPKLNLGDDNGVHFTDFKTA